MQGVRCYHRNRVEIGLVDKIGVVVEQVEAVRGRERLRHCGIDVAARDHLEARAAGKAADDLLAPPTEPDNSDPDHDASLVCRTAATAGFSDCLGDCSISL